MPPLNAELKRQNVFNVSGLERQNAVIMREIAERRYDIARRDQEAAFAAAPSPSTMR
jgi:hypothetical protein